LGFCGIAVEPTHGRTIVGHAYGGALHIWDVATSDQSVDKDIQWKASPCITGHFAGITDCCWEAANGDYLLTVSNDQTCRLWAQLKPELIIEKQNKQSAWFELARPQVHGYNLSAVASLSTHSHPHLIVTGADEKEIRAFDAPKTTLRLLDTLTDVRPIPNLNGIPTERVERAYIPSLGLSNKASPADAAAEDDETDIESKVTSSTQTMVRLPLERDLGAVSLWPEVQKLFGHNTEVYCLAAMSLPHSDNASENWTIVASSAKARDADDAKIRLWNVRSGQCIQVLSDGHKSTVATIDFSPSGEYLASSGKDRRLCLWKKQDSTSSSMPNYTLAWAMDAAHRRIVWSVHFCPYELHMLASASRDGCIKVWSIQEDPPELESKTKVTEIVNFCPSFQRGGKPDAVTAISFAPIPLINQAVLAIGLESGRIELWCISYEKGAALKVTSTPYMLSGLDPSLCHCDTVTKLAWRPIRSNTTSDATEKAGDITDDPILYLASCSMDHGCRIFEIEFQQAK
jgi:elongator complex protein 2